MGHAAAIGLGYATARPAEHVVVLDGDGALLMHLGVLSTIGALAPSRFVHVVVDNGCYASTGGQATTASRTDFAGLARACGYRTAETVASIEALVRALDSARAAAGPHLVAVSAGSTMDSPPPRASAAMSLVDVAARLVGRSATESP
jgi:phosphonopyruvate decarboxylase